MARDQLSSHELFSFLRPDEVTAISNVSQKIELREGDAVFRSGDPAESLYAVLEGRISLRLPRDDGVSLQIEEISTGSLFGSCVCVDLSRYRLTAVCTADSKLLKISAAGLKRVMDDDLTVGYPMQRMISRTYFARYLETVSKLRSVAEALPVTAG